MFRTRTIVIALALAALTFGAVACGSDSDADSTTTTAKATTSTAAAGGESAATVKFDKTVQQELADVGCDPGPVDGTFGPETDAALIRFQTASGLTADGQYGPETAAALTKAVEAGDAVCTKSAGTTTTTTAKTTTTASNGEAPCTATALLQGLPAEGEQIGSYVCSGGYAAGTLSDGTTKFILQSDKGTWVALSQDPCGSASAGLPPIILTDGCPA